MHGLLEELKSGEYLIRVELLERYPDLDHLLDRIRSRVFPKYEVIEIENPAVDYQRLIRLQPTGHDPALPIEKKLPPTPPPAADVKDAPDYNENIEKMRALVSPTVSEPTYEMQVENWEEYAEWKRTKGEPVPTFHEYVAILLIPEASKEKLLEKYEKSLG